MNDRVRIDIDGDGVADVCLVRGDKMNALDAARFAALAAAIDRLKTEPGLRAVVHYAIEKRLGARGLRSILEEVLADVLFEAPEKRGETFVVDEAYALGRLAKMER